MRPTNKIIKNIICMISAIILIADTLYMHTFASSYGPGNSNYNQHITNANITKPEIISESAILINAKTGEVLYEKDADSKRYPASITKIMTALLVIENCNMDDIVTFSKIATTNLETAAVTLNMTEGDKVSIKDCLYGLMLKSANDIANGLAEHVSGSISGFADMMNQKAKSFGCTDTHFVNPNGLNNSEHYTTARDMAKIAAVCFDNETFTKIASTMTYTFPATIKSNGNTTSISMGHKMIYPSDSRYYASVIGGKTGYTSKAGNTLVTCAQYGEIKLIVVILKSKQSHYIDTKALLDYGFALYGITDAATNKVPYKATEDISGYKTGWIEINNRWQYLKQSGSLASSEILAIDGYEYWFDNDGYMATGWRQDTSGYWYYMRPSFGGMKKSAWIEGLDGSWYYVDSDGRMLTDTTTPDGYKVDKNGVYIQ